MAVSAAFPGLIGPFMLHPNEYVWRKRPQWDAKPNELTDFHLPYKKLHIYDGGVYDNLGMEPLFDIGKQNSKNSTVSYLIISDASAPFIRNDISRALSIIRFKRIADILLEQNRSLRVRAFASYLTSYPHSGMYLQLGSEVSSKIENYSHMDQTSNLPVLQDKWLSVEQVKRVAHTPTRLNQIDGELFKLIEQHGYETTKWNSLLFGGNDICNKNSIEINCHINHEALVGR